LTKGFGKKALARRRNAGGGSKIKGGKLKMDGSGTTRDAAIEAALTAEVSITLEKKAGSETFCRDIKASSSAAAMNGLAVLVREYAVLLDMTVAEVLAVLATVLTVPAIREGQEQHEL